MTTTTHRLRSTRIQFFIVLATLLGLLTMMSASLAVNVTAITPQWQSPTGSSGAPTCVTTDNASAIVTVFYGDNDTDTLNPCPPTSQQSGFGFASSTNGTFANGTPFLLGELTHYNHQVFASSLLTGATLNLSFASTAPVVPAISTSVALDETANNLATCPYGDTAPCADRMTITPSTVQFTDAGNDYQVEILGLIPDTGSGCTYNKADLRLSFISEENSDNASCLYGRVTQISDAELQITKSTTSTVLQPGDLVDYQIDYTCASTTDSCLGVQLTDYLPDELSYVGSTGSTHTIAATGIYSTSSNTVEFDFVDPLPAGSTGFVRIRARVRDDGTLANGQTITNTATSTQTNGPTGTTTTSTPVQTTSNWDVQKTGDATAYISTEPPITNMTYTVQICPNGSNVNLINAQMVDTLPAGAVFVSASGGGAYSAGPNTVTWTLGDLAASAGCAPRTVVVQFPNPPFSASQTVTNNVTGTGTIPGVGPFTDTATLPRVLQNFVPLPAVTMDKSTNRTDYTVGASVDYFLTPRNTGNTNLYNLTMTDNLPDQIRVTQVITGTSAYPITLEYAVNGSSTYTAWGGTYNSNTTLPVSALGLPGGTWITSIRWHFNPGSGTPPQWTLTSPAIITGTITSPDRLGNTINTGDHINNSATLAWEYLPGGVGTCASPNAQCGNQQDGASIDVVIVPNPVFNKTSSGGVSDQQRFLIGQDIGSFNLNVNNNTGIPVDLFTLTDSIPTPFGVTSINVGNAGNSGTVGVRYQVNGSATWNIWPGSPFAGNSTHNVTDLSLPGGSYVSKLEFSYGTIPGSFTTSPSIHGTTLATGWDGTPVNGNGSQNMVNNAQMDWTFLAAAHTISDSTSNPIHEPTVSPSATKSTTTGGPYIPTSAVGYRLTFGASGTSPSNVMDSPVVADLLPANVNYVSYTFNANGSALTGPTFVQIPNYNATGRTLLRWTFGGSLNRGQTASIDLSTTLAAGTPSGNLDNSFAVTVNDMPVNGGTIDSSDLDGDGQFNDTIITASTSIPVDQLVGLDSQKRVKGELDTAYSVYPAYGQTVPNGLVAYRLSIVNRGNIPVNNVRVVDILPFVGDTGVQDTRPRNSAWRPMLTSAVTPQAGVSIYYSTATNPCRPEIVKTGPVGCTAPNWSLVPPADLDTVRSLRFDFAGTLTPGQTFTFDWMMRAPASGPTDGQVAWNSFAFTSTNASTGVPLRPAEPNKVGIIYKTTTPTAVIDLEKHTNDIDADLAPGPLVVTSSTVTWKYIVTNIGQTRLNNITVTDDVIGAITCPPGILEIGASVICTATGTALAGQYVNNGTVIGTAVDNAGNPIDSDGNPGNGVQLIQPTDTDPSHYYGYTPALAQLGDYTWIDLDNDGQQDGGEPPLGGVSVHLLDSTGIPVDDPTKLGTQDYITTTDASGLYRFVNLPAGDYIVKFDVPSAYTLTTANSGNDASDSDASTTAGPNLGKTGSYHLNAGDVNLTVDAGFIALASLGDRVWIDTDDDGLQDAGETATPAIIQGMQVQLLDSGNNVVATTFTDVDGLYLFNDLIPGTYSVRFTAPPSGYLWTTPNTGADDIDSDVNVTTYTTTPTTLDAGENDPTLDAGLVQVANIGDYVWADNNFNGIQDGGESGVSGVTVRLLNSSGTQATDDSGTLIPDATTDGSGFYHFTNLRPGQYEIRFTRPTGYIFTTPDASGSTDSNDSDAIASGANIGRTLVTTLSPGETDNTWDAGVIQLASIGDKVWLDTQNDGQQNGGDAGVAGATVTLLNANTLAPITQDALGNAIAPIVTTGTGLYSFTNLDPRIPYVVDFQRPANYVFSKVNQGNDTSDSDAAPSASLSLGEGRTGTYNLAAGQNNTTVDAGLVQPAAIGNFIWYDTDNDGLQNGGDAPVTGVTVRLLNSAGNQAADEQGNLIPDQVTTGTGTYHFTNLVPADYSLAFSTLPATYTFAKRDIVGTDVTDSDPNRFTGRTITTTLSPNEDDLSWDAGLVVSAALGDFVWEDRNANGQQDGGLESGLDGVTVRLLDGSNNAIDNPNTAAIGDAYTVVTAGGGLYAFVGLPPNETYRVRFDRPTGYIFTVDNQGNDASDSDGVVNRPTSGNITTGNITTLTPGSTDNTWDEGVLRPSALGDFVWSDGSNAHLEDGLQTSGEAVLSGVTVHLYASDGVTTIDDPNQNGTQAYTTTTNGSGIYAFTNLYPGQYVIQWDTPAGYKRAVYDADGVAGSTTDSDMQTTGGAAGKTPTITLPYFTTDNAWDAGFVQLAALGNFVWRDNNGNGRQDGGEPGINGVTVRLYDATNITPGSQLATTTTATIGGIVGSYAFTGLDPDLDYVVEFVLPTPAANVSHFIFSPQDAAVATDVTDSDADMTTGRTATIPLNPGQTDNDRDAGLTPLAQLGDYVWNDVNGNGVQDGGESGVQNVRVDLYFAATPATSIANTLTSVNGFYQFIDLVPGNYVVKFTLPSGYMFTLQDATTDGNDSDATRLGANTGYTGTYTLNYNDSNQTVDAGILQPASLGDFVWYDANNNGIQDGGGAEPGQAGVVVRLLAANGSTPVNDPNNAAPTPYVITTDVNGAYNFVNLFPGTYTVKFDLPASITLPQPPGDYVIAKQNQGGDTSDSDADRASGVTGTYTLAQGDNNITVDAGILLRGAKLGDYVWEDLNNNGVQDSSETGVNGVTVTLLNGSGGTDIDSITPGIQTLSTTTGNNPSTTLPGWYQFTGLVPDNYIVRFTLPSGYQFSPQNAGSPNDDTNDSDADTTSGQTAVITIAENGDDQTWDAGLVPLASIGNFVWIDQNNNGIQDGGVNEPGLDGVTVHLLDSTGTTTLATTVTAGGGAYLFDNLPPDVAYVVQFDLPTHYQRSPVDATGSTDANDSDASLSDGKSPVTFLSPKEYDDSVDAGFVPLATLGDYVWNDVDADGVQDSGELGVNNVGVHLYLDSNLTTAIANTTTNGTGFYQFADLVKADYVVKFDLPATYAFTLKDAAAATDATDSDATRVGTNAGFTTTYPIDWGDSNQTIDAGIFQYAALGDYVWEDVNNDGVQGAPASEPPVQGVLVHLLASNGTTAIINPNDTSGTAYTALTDVNGLYQFTGLFPGSYKVKFDLPAGYDLFAKQNIATGGGTDSNDSDPDRSTGLTTQTYTLIAGQTDNTVDAGLLKYASLGDFVWNDTDGNGVQDSGELGVQGVTVELYDSTDALIDTTTTGTNGDYLFDSLVPGDYYVKFVPISTYIFTQQDQGSDSNDSDADRFTGKAISTTLTSGKNDLTWDAGILQPAALGDYVWHDTNDNGVQDSGEPVVQSVLVHLLASDGVTTITNPNNNSGTPYTATTDVNGLYHFTGLFPGDYKVKFDLPAGYDLFARQNVTTNGGTDSNDSDADRSTSLTTQIYTLIEGQTDNTVDAGLLKYASLGDFVWNDLNGNGIQDGGLEVGVSGVTVELYDSSDTLIDTTTTGTNGEYLFDSLVPGDYYVKFVPTSAYIFTKQDAAAATDLTDSDADRFTGKTISTTLVSGENDLTWDAGILLPAALGDYVWNDVNDDGAQGAPATEAPISGVTVHLLAKDGVTAIINPNNNLGDPYTATTDVNGLYHFTGLFPDDYKVKFDLPSSNYVFSRLDNTTDGVDSDANRSTGVTPQTYTLIAGQTDNTVDAGMMQRASLGNYVWHDVDGDGIQDGSELGVNGVTITLLNGTGGTDIDPITAGTQTYSVVTANDGTNDGAYHFINLVPGNYQVQFTLPSGYIFTRQDNTSDGLDSDADRFTGKTIVTTLVSGQNDLSWDAGILQPAALGDYVWHDTDDDGIQDGGEPVVQGVTVHLLANDGVTAIINPNDNTATAYTTTTDVNGLYHFTGLFPDDYKVKFDLPAGYNLFARQDTTTDTADSDAIRSTGITGTYTLIEGQTDNTVDAGLLQYASLGNYVWYDLDGKGIQNNGELGANGVTVTLLNGTGGTDIDPITAGTQTYSVVTANNGTNDGAYLFSNLVPGDYQVQFTLPSGYIFTRQDTTTDGLDSDADRFTGKTIVTTLVSGQNDLTWDAGILQPAALGDYVWHDSDDDGVQDSGEAVVQGVTVHLLANDGITTIDDPNTSGTQAYTATTDVNGLYHFTGLFPGDYTVKFDLPAGYDLFARQDNTADAADSDADRITGKTGSYTLTAGQTDNTVDAGLLQYASLGDYVWHDTDGNGIQDSGEAGVNGVTVTLLNSTGGTDIDPITAGTQTYSVVTANDGTNDGAYHFTHLVPGDYLVQFTLPNGYIFTRQDNTSDDADSDADRFTGKTIVTTLVSGANDLTWDAGILQPAALGNYVWEDVNDDGIQGTPVAEAPISGVTVHLLASDGVTAIINPNDNTSTAYTATTDADGLYHFTGLFPGDYKVKFDLPSSNYVFSRLDQGGDDDLDSDSDRTTGITGTYTLIAGQTDDTVDAGLMQRASIGDFVWRDNNDNGIQDSGEPGIDGVTVELYDSTNTLVDTTTTNGGGAYLFDNLVPDTYSLKFYLPSDQFEFSDQNQGSDAEKDSDADFTTGATVTTHLLSGEDDMSWDAGMVPLASIGDRVWIDIDNNGVQDGGEDNFPGITVNLLDKDGNVIDTQVTGASGDYLFEKLTPADYGIQVILPDHYQFSPQNVTTNGGNPATDSDVDFTTGKTIITTLIPNEHDLTWDAGLVPLVSVGNYVWIDINNDGVQDGGEAGFSGVTVNLLDKNGNVIDTQQTGANGDYLFSDLPPADYRIEVVPPYNYQFSPQDASGSDLTDSDVDFTTGRTILFTVPPGVDDDTRDAGLVPLTSIGDFVWRDNNGDGIQDTGEPGIPGITVNLLNSHGVVATTHTDADGKYLFDLLPPGDYLIEVITPINYIHSPQNQGGDTGADSDIDPVTQRTPFTTLEPDEDDMTWDAGLAPLATIGDRVWNDKNSNGVQDIGELGMPNVQVRLLNGLGVFLKETKTDANGNYLFENLLPGNYIIQVVLPTGYRFTPQDKGLDDATDGDANPSNGRTIATTLEYGEIDLTWDAGVVLIPPSGSIGSIGDTVWIDTNHNGVQDNGEMGIPNVNVTLTLPNGSTITTTTDGSGKYLFPGLFPGGYTVTVDVNTLPPGLVPTYDLDGVLDSRTTVDLSLGEEFLDADFGYVPMLRVIQPTATPTTPSEAAPFQSVPACQRDCVNWQLYHTNQTGDWEIFRLGDLADRPSINTNLSQGKGADDMSPTRSPNAEWIVFSSNRDGNWELYLAPTDGDNSKIRRLTYNTIAIDTDPVWGPNNYVAYETTRDGNWELYLLDMTTGKERRLTNNAASDLNAYWSTDGTKLIFQSNRSGLWQIYQLDLATNIVTPLSDGTANNVDPVYSSDSSKISFRSYRDGDGSKSTLYLMDANGGNLKRISDINGDATDQSWSSDDSMIAYQSDLDGDLDVYVYQVSTGITRKLTDNAIPDYAPTWLCNTTTVVFTSDASGNPDIYSADADPIQSPAIDVTKDAQQLTTDPADDIYPENSPVEENASREGQLPNVSLGDQTNYLKPDASVTKADPSLDSGKAWEPVNSCPTVCPAWTLYQSNRTGDQEVFRMDAQGGNDMNLSLGVGANDRGPTRSPDAQWVAFTSDRDGSEELYIVAADGTGLRRVTNDAATDTDPDWSPDSQRIAFESNRGGKWDVYMMDVQTGVVMQITSGIGDNRNADWSSAGGTIAFESNRDGRWQLYVYDLATGTTKHLINLPQNVFDAVYSNGGGQIAFQVTANDGHTVLYVAEQDGSNPHAISDPSGNASNPQWYVDDTLFAYQSDLDGDLDVYVYDFKTETTRKLTENTVPDYAPTWTCGEPVVIFTSQADGNDDIFKADALPITAPALDVVTQAQQLTNNPATDRYPLGAPNEEDGTRDS